MRRLRSRRAVEPTAWFRDNTVLVVDVVEQVNFTQGTYLFDPSSLHAEGPEECEYTVRRIRINIDGHFFMPLSEGNNQSQAVCYLGVSLVSRNEAAMDPSCIGVADGRGDWMKIWSDSVFVPTSSPGANATFNTLYRQNTQVDIAVARRVNTEQAVVLSGCARPLELFGALPDNCDFKYRIQWSVLYQRSLRKR